jgi:hypothetical protein
MTSRVLTLGAAVLAVVGLLVRTDQGQAQALAERVNPRPRLMFAPGEYQRLAAEVAGSRREAFERLAAEIDRRGARPWNERDLQLESQALAARVMLDRGDDRGPRYLGYARQTMSSMLATHTYTNWRESHDIVTEGGRWIEAMSLAHDWLHEHWTADERQRMGAWLVAEVSDWVGGNRLARASASPFRNDAARGTAALVLAGLTLFDEPGHEEAARRALSHAQPYYEAMLAAHTYAGAGGGMAEGTFYGNFTAWSQTLVAEALYTGAGVADAYTRTPFYLARLGYAIFAAWPGYTTNQFGFDVHQLAPVFGDARRGPTGSALYHRATVLLLGKRFADTPAARAAYWVVNREETSKTYTAEWALYDLLLWSPAVTPERPTELAYREATLGQVFARSDWSDDATWMSFNAGPHLDSHQHYDAGNLTLFKRVDLAVDSGSFDGFGSTHWYNYYARTVAHNTITVTDPSERWEGLWGGVPDDRVVNDGGQRTAAPLTPAPTLDEYLANRAAYDHGRIVGYRQAPWGVYSRADLTNAYQNATYRSARPGGARNGAKVAHVEREVVYLRGDAGANDAFIVFDRVVATNPAFRKAVRWHAREPFIASPRAGTDAPRASKVSDGETRYEGADRYDFASDVAFEQGARKDRSRLIVTVFAVDPVVVREIGRRPSTPSPDHTTFTVAHRHRHVQDYLVEDPRGLTNRDATLGALGRPEWPPFNPPEQQWLWNDGLVGGWGQTRLQIEPDRPRAADRFLTVLVPTDAGGSGPDISLARPVEGTAAGVVVRNGTRTEVVMFGGNPSGGDLERGAVDAPMPSASGTLTVGSLTPGAHYAIRVGGGGTTQRIAVTREPEGAFVADEAGLVRVALERVPRVKFGANRLGGTGAAAGFAATAAVGDSSTASVAQGTAGQAAAQARPAPKHPGLTMVAATDPAEVTQWDRRVLQMIRAGDLALRETVRDTVAAGRTHERYVQLYKGVPVFGGDLRRQVEKGKAVSLFGTVYGDITIEARPALKDADAAAIFQRLSGSALGPSRPPELVVLPTDDGSYRLTYRARLATADDVVMTFVDAATGDVVLSFSDLKRPVR